MNDKSQLPIRVQISAMAPYVKNVGAYTLTLTFHLPTHTNAHNKPKIYSRSD